MEQFVWILIGGIPSLLVGIVLAKMARSEKKADQREADRDEREELILESLNANGCVIKELYECRYHDKPANGDLEEAYQYQKEVKHRLEDYMRRRAAR